NLKQARANLALAKKAVNDTFDLAKTHPLLRRENMRAVRKLLFEKALPFYENFHGQTPDDLRARSKLAEQWSRVAFITYEIGRITEARKAYEQAANIWQALVKARPGVAL